MKSHKAQLAVETMIIYGLVILVALTVIGGLLYFNILDVGSYLPDKCDIGGAAELKCEEVKFSSASGTNNFEIGIRNIGQKPIELLTVDITDESGVHFQGVKSGTGTVPAGTIGSGTPPITLGPGEISLVSISTGTGAKQGKVLRGTIITSYKYKDGAVTQEASGTIRVRAS